MQWIIRVAAVVFCCLSWLSVSAPLAEGEKPPPVLSVPQRISASAEATPPESPELSLFEDIPVVVTASQRPERVTQAPSIVSIITREDIERMGARTIMDVLRTIPGMEIMRDAANISQIAVRGLRSQTSSGIKVLIDGHALNDPMTGGATTFYEDIPLNHVHRIEIIRGPAAVSYGANAFVSVVNILTTQAQEIDGIEMSLEGGNFQTYHPSMLFGDTFNDVAFMFYADYSTTNGAEYVMQADVATLYDETLALEGFSPVSLAPGSFQEEQEKLYLSWSLEHPDFTLRGGFLDNTRGPFLTDFYSLNEDSTQDTRHVYAELEYHRFLTERLALRGRFYGDYFDVSTFQKAAEGIAVPASPPDDFLIYPDGLQSEYSAEGWRLGSEARCDIRLFQGNDLTLGVAYEYFAVDDASFRTNLYNADLGIEPDRLIDLRAVIPEIGLSSYQWFGAVFARDTWTVRRNVDLTLGVRGDYFHEFGGVFTPKLGVVYEPDPDLNIKLLFGSAFRIPSFTETFIEITSSSSDEEEEVTHDLAAEDLLTFEVGAGYKPFDWLTGEMNYFYTEIRELAEVAEADDTALYPLGSTRAYENVGGIDVQGVEVELRGHSEQEIGLGPIPRIIGSTFRLNYSYQDSHDSTTHEKMPNMARHKGNIGIGFNLSAEQRPQEELAIPGIFRRFSNEFSLYFNLFLCGERPRSSRDVRDSLPAYTVADMALTAYDVFETGIDLSLSVKNVLDEEYHDPALEFSTRDSATLPDDVPNPGRTVFLELRYTF